MKYILKLIGFILITSYAMIACISEQTGSPLSEGETLAGDEVEVIEGGNDLADEQGEDADAGENTGDEMAGEPAGSDEIAGEQAGNDEMAGEQAGEQMSEPPPPSPNLDACDRFCQRIEDCVYPGCEAISQIPPQQFCRGWCQSTGEEWLNQGADLSCEDFSRRIYGFSPELQTLCEADPNVDNCESICEFGTVCGLVSNECLDNCNRAGVQSQLCFQSASEAGDCRRFAQCLQGGGGQGDGRQDSYEDVCTDLCEREISCVSNACAPGSVNAASTNDCVDACVQEQASQEELFARYQRSCEEVVTETLMNDSALAELCQTPEDQVCSLLCTSTVTGCGELDQTNCEAECAGWDEANYYCLRTSATCDEVSICLIDQSEQERCRRSCDHLQLCLEEACPPRIIPPELTDTCTADCFEDPLSEEELIDWEMSSCREVREFIYQDNQQLRPICEGNQDFRPTPAECSAFCDAGFDTCILGNRTICLSACSGLTREQYTCSLQAGTDCQSIESCLVD